MILASELAKAGFRYLGRSYQEMDCQKFVEKCLSDIGIRKDLPGSNAWYRKMTWRGTPEECRKRFGGIPAGAFLFILEMDGGERKRGYTDGLGNASHIGLVTGQGQGAIHSSQSRGGVFESSFKGKSIRGGWNRVGLWDALSYGEKVDRILTGTGTSTEAPNEGGSHGTETPAGSGDSPASSSNVSCLSERSEEPGKAIVSAPNGGTVKLRNRASTQCGLYWDIPSGTEVQVLKEGSRWWRIRALGRTGYMMREFLQTDG